ncbi:MAG: hypothetical protein D6719_00410, partial [Candidatus Dadabacteria bacterium]
MSDSNTLSEIKKITTSLLNTCEQPSDKHQQQVRSLIYSSLLAIYCEKNTTLSLPSFFNKASGKQRLLSKNFYKHLQALNRSFQSTLFTAHLNNKLPVKNPILNDLLDSLNKISSNLNVETLAYSFEYLQGNGLNKKEGIFYTPKPVVEEIVDNAVRRAISTGKFSTTNPPLILDPACGSGIFLIESLRFLSGRIFKKMDSPSARLKLALRSLFGVDKDPLTVEVARILLLLEITKGRQLDFISKKAIESLSTNI